MTSQVTVRDELGWDGKKLDLIRSTICKGCSDGEIQLFSYVCQRTGLDPFARQIYPVKRANAMTIQTGIDGYRLVAERTGRYCPGKETTYEYDKNGKLLRATAYLKKMTPDGSWHEVSASAYYSEYVQEYNGKPSNFWGKMPHVMLGKCAEALALRKAFPSDLSGLYTEEEMSQADSITVKPKESSKIEPLTSPEETVSKEEINDLLNLVNQCGDEYKLNFENLIKDRGLETAYNLSKSLYNGLKKSALVKVAQLKKVELEAHNEPLNQFEEIAL